MIEILIKNRLFVSRAFADKYIRAGVIDFLRVRKSWDEDEHPREGGGQFAAKGGKNESAKIGSGISAIKLLSDILSTGKTMIVHNKSLGDISVDCGETGKSGYGLNHIIEQRAVVKDGMRAKETAALLYLVCEALTDGKLKNSRVKGKNKYALEKKGVLTIIKKAEDRNGEKFILTGYALHDKKEEATEAIRTVIARYGATPEFSDFRKQVGAVISSLSTVSFKTGGRSSEVKKSVRILIPRRIKIKRGLLRSIGL